MRLVVGPNIVVLCFALHVFSPVEVQEIKRVGRVLAILCIAEFIEKKNWRNGLGM